MQAETNFDDIRAILRRVAENSEELAVSQKELKESQKDTDQITNRNAKLIGDIGNKFGSFTEGMAFPSMERILRRRFGMTTVATRYKAQREGETMEIDVLGLANGDINAVVVVEVKSHLKERDVEQTLRMLTRFTDFFPEHRGKKLYGILAYVDGAEEARQQAVRAGLYTARIHDEVFDLLTENPFTPRDFSQPVAVA